jgi:hypothetical protein
MPTNSIRENSSLSRDEIIDEELRTQLEVLIEQGNPMEDAAQRALELYS